MTSLHSVPAFSRSVKLRTARQQRPSGFVLNAAHNQRPAYIRFFQIFGLFPSQSRSRGTIHDHEHGLQILRRNVLASAPNHVPLLYAGMCNGALGSKTEVLDRKVSNQISLDQVSRAKLAKSTITDTSIVSAIHNHTSRRRFHTASDTPMARLPARTEKIDTPARSLTCSCSRGYRRFKSSRFNGYASSMCKPGLSLANGFKVKNRSTRSSVQIVQALGLAS